MGPRRPGGASAECRPRPRRGSPWQSPGGRSGEPSRGCSCRTDPGPGRHSRCPPRRGRRARGRPWRTAPAGAGWRRRSPARCGPGRAGGRLPRGARSAVAGPWPSAGRPQSHPFGGLRRAHPRPQLGPFQQQVVEPRVDGVDPSAQVVEGRFGGHGRAPGAARARRLAVPSDTCGIQRNQRPKKGDSPGAEVRASALVPARLSHGGQGLRGVLRIAPGRTPASCALRGSRAASRASTVLPPTPFRPLPADRAPGRNATRTVTAVRKPGYAGRPASSSAPATEGVRP